jgi:hypothetical protein
MTVFFLIAVGLISKTTAAFLCLNNEEEIFIIMDNSTMSQNVSFTIYPVSNATSHHKLEQLV